MGLCFCIKNCHLIIIVVEVVTNVNIVSHCYDFNFSFYEVTYNVNHPLLRVFLMDAADV